ncbi:MAG TPA: bifunctional folylpolyglutamate synthase/dihydrofolate synthase, partial [Planctomycetaceae bacterium]|nr:bifunctional folylpolyglutamate synthase/dihydrofolate synthase [Planctomycetaceae bacterium]
MNETSEAYNNVLDFLYGRIDYERKDTPQRTKGFKLDRMRELLRRLGNPQDSLPIIHIAGTKGKGSTAHMIVAVLSAAGLRCGLYTSPHLETLEERFVINDTICTPAELIKLVDLVSPAVSDLDKLSETDKQSVGQPTFFEITTAMALLYFQRQNVDLAVLEVGLGGRLDSTNVCQPCVSVITSISFDHVDILGNTLRMIATEKAGIIKTGVPVICGVDQTEPKETIQRIAADLDAPLWNIHDDFHFLQPATGIEI